MLDEALSGIEEDLEISIASKLISESSLDVVIYSGHRANVLNLFHEKIDLNTSI